MVRRRSEYRRRKAAERAHIVEGLLIALDAIDDVIHIIRTSADTAEARARLMEAFDLSDVQTQQILDMPLRRLATLEVGKLRAELAELQATIAALTEILEDDAKLRRLVSERARRGGQGAPHRSSHRAAGVGGPARRVGRAPRGGRRAVPRAALLDRTARAHGSPLDATPRPSGRGPGTTSIVRERAHHHAAAPSGWSPRAAGSCGSR